jgi:CII-binding regulator of phage lambda lysogenization HflD
VVEDLRVLCHVVFFCLSCIRRRIVDQVAISEQVLVEHKILAHIVSALRATVDWKYQGADLTRKLNYYRLKPVGWRRS